MKQLLKDAVDFLRSLPWMILMWTFLGISYVQEKWYKFRGVKFKYSCEGFVYRDKSNGHK